MRYAEFKTLVADKGWTLDQVRCEVPPSDDLLALMDEIGLAKYERFALQMARESKTVTTAHGNRLYDAGGRGVTIPE